MTTTTATYTIEKDSDPEITLCYDVVNESGKVVESFETRAEAREWIKETIEEEREAADEAEREAADEAERDELIDSIDLSDLSIETLKKIKALIKRA